MSDRLDTFDNVSQKITQVRGKEYQHPSIDFAKAMELKACVQNCTDPLVRHTLEMICLKIARLVHNPSHLDSWIDIAGYARCGVMVTEPKKEPEALIPLCVQCLEPLGSQHRPSCPRQGLVSEASIKR